MPLDSFLFVFSAILLLPIILLVLAGIKLFRKVSAESVLIVDDLGEELATLVNVIESNANFDVFIEGNVKQAREFLNKYQPKYAFLDLDLSCSTDGKGEFAGVQLFKFIFQNQLLTKPIAVSMHEFSETEGIFQKQLQELPNRDNLLASIKADYIFKGHPDNNYADAVLDKLKILESQKS